MLTAKVWIVSVLWINYLWNQYHRMRKHKKLSLTAAVPKKLSVPEAFFKKNNTLKLRKLRYRFVKDFVNFIVALTTVHFPVLPSLWHQASLLNTIGGELVTSCIWYFMFTTLYAVINLPLSLYKIMTIDIYPRGCNKELIVIKKFFSFWTNQLFRMFVACLVIGVVSRGSYFMLGLLLGFCLVILTVGCLYLLLGPPRLYNQARLHDGALRSQLVQLAAEVRFPLGEIFVEERDDVPSHWIYFYRASKKKNIVICETLLPTETKEECTDEEILALTAVELARWRFNHGLKYIIAVEVNLIVEFAVFVYLYSKSQIYSVFGFHEVRPIFVGVYVVLHYVMCLFNSLSNFCFLGILRYLSNEADLFAVSIGKGNALINALCTLETLEEKGGPYVSGARQSAWKLQKPNLLERIQLIDAATSITNL